MVDYDADPLAQCNAKPINLCMKPGEVYTAMDFALAILRTTHPGAYDAALRAIVKERGKDVEVTEAAQEQRC